MMRHREPRAAPGWRRGAPRTVPDGRKRRRPCLARAQEHVGRSAMEPRGVGSHPPLHPSRFFHLESTRGHYGERAEENPVAEGMRARPPRAVHGPPRSPPRSFDPLALATAVAIAVLGFLPVANWVAGGHHAPWYAPVASTWVTGSVLAIGIGLVLAIASRGSPPCGTTGLVPASPSRSTGRRR